VVVALPPPPPLPFRLTLNAQHRPRTFADLEESLYSALPEHHLRFIAGYFGGGDYRTLRARYGTAVDFSGDLFRWQILTEAWRQWGFTHDRNPFIRRIECVGERDFPFYLIMHLAFRYIDERFPADGPRDDDMLNAYRAANTASRRLFERCERRQQPR
jgi:hypothetical protein